MAEKKVIEIQINSNAKSVTADINSAAQATTNLGNASAEAGSKSKTLNDVKNVITGMVPSLKSAEGGVNGFSTSLKALLANPVVLVITGIVGALKFVYEAFQSNVKIGKEIAAVWAGLSGVGSQIVDSVMGLVRAFAYAAEAAYKFITLDFTGAAKAMKKANGEATTSYNQLRDSVNGTTFAILRGLEKQQQANNKAKKEQAVRQSEINKLLVQSREILTDETASIKDKKKALEEVTKAEKDSSKEKVRTAQVDLNILKSKAKALGGQAEVKMKQEIREATIALNEAETENAMTGIKLNKQRKMLLRQEVADGKAAADEAKTRAKEKSDAEKEYQKTLEATLAKIDVIKKANLDANKTTIQIEKEALIEKYKSLRKEAELTIKDKTQLNVALKVLEEGYQREKLALDTKYLDIEYQITKKAKQAANKARIDLENEYLNQVADLQEANTNAKLTEEEREIRAVEDKYFTLEELAKGNAEELKIIEEAKGRELGVINDKYRKEDKEKNKKLQDQKVQGVKDGLSMISDIASLFAGKSKKQQENAFKVQKAVNIANAVVDTYKAANMALASAPPPLNFIAMGAAITAGLVNVKKIASTKFEGGTTSTDTTAPSGGSVMSPSFNVVGNSGINQLAQLQQSPMKAYVVSGDMTTAQSLDRNRIENATLVK
jgi:hypothetical protein